jgi:hypothetical protein
MASEPRNGASMTELVTGIVGDIGDLIRQELRFARTEVASDLRKTRNAAIWLSAGVAVVLVAAIQLAFALGHLVHWCSLPRVADDARAGLPLWAAHGLVSLGLMAIGGIIGSVGISLFSDVNPLPEKTLQTIQENVTLTPASPSPPAVPTTSAGARTAN